jgi:hypothetical protein
MKESKSALAHRLGYKRFSLFALFLAFTLSGARLTAVSAATNGKGCLAFTRIGLAVLVRIQFHS